MSSTESPQQVSTVAKVEAILLAAAGPEARRESGRHWSLKDPPLLCRGRASRLKQIDEAKMAILATMARTGASVISHPESPIGLGLPGLWEPAVMTGAWKLPIDLDLCNGAVRDWLFTLGNWQVFSSEPLGAVPDLSRLAVTEGLAWLDRSHLEVAVDSFHDDVGWVVLLGRVPHAG
jgi:hypothetical protein